LSPFLALVLAAELVDTSACPAACRPVLGILVVGADRYCRAVCDNASHASLAALMWHSVAPSWPSIWGCSESRAFVRERMLAFACGSLLDLDHFLRAHSLSLADATYPSPVRPPGHALVAVPVFAVAVACALQAAAGKERSKQRYWRAVILVMCALASHQLRDATRRGLWLWPLQLSTAPLGRNAYRAALVALALTARVALAFAVRDSGDAHRDRPEAVAQPGLEV